MTRPVLNWPQTSWDRPKLFFPLVREASGVAERFLLAISHSWKLMSDPHDQKLV